MVPDWAPNVHPLVVHFPVALLAVAAFVDAVALAVRRRHPWVRASAVGLYALGALGTAAAFLTGRERLGLGGPPGPGAPDSERPRRLGAVPHVVRRALRPGPRRRAPLRPPDGGWRSTSRWRRSGPSGFFLVQRTAKQGGRAGLPATASPSAAAGADAPSASARHLRRRPPRRALGRPRPRPDVHRCTRPAHAGGPAGHARRPRSPGHPRPLRLRRHRRPRPPPPRAGRLRLPGPRQAGRRSPSRSARAASRAGARRRRTAARRRSTDRPRSRRPPSAPTPGATSVASSSRTPTAPPPRPAASGSGSTARGPSASWPSRLRRSSRGEPVRPLFDAHLSAF